MRKPCTIDNCNRPSKGRGLCAAHYARQRRWGNPLAGRPSWGPGFPDTLWTNVDKCGPPPDDRPDLGPCWIWTGPIQHVAGYAQIYVPVSVRRPGATKTQFVHRVVYELEHGEITAGLQLDHLCRVRACCNPAHLEPVTIAENIRRGHAARSAS